MTNEIRGNEALVRLLEYPDIDRVIDVGSGSGEHAALMREAGKTVTTVSMQEPANHVGNYLAWTPSLKADAVWACHVLEHQPDPGAFLRKCHADLREGGYLFVTVPPAKDQIVGGHVTIWNAGLLIYQLILAGFDCSQARVGTYAYNISVIVQKPAAPVPLGDLAHDFGDIERLAHLFPTEVHERIHGEFPNIRWGDDQPQQLNHVAIVALGPSSAFYMAAAKKAGDRKRFADYVIAINAMGSVIQSDLVFHMDDIRIQERRAAANPDGNIAGLVDWLRTYRGRVMTSRAHPDYPYFEEFPLEDVLNKLGSAYINGTGAAALAYAIYLGPKEISLWGFDFTYPDAHKNEKGRGCVEYWLGYATKAGIGIRLPPSTSLMDSFEDSETDEAKIYGYDTVKLRIAFDPDADKFQVSKTLLPEDEWPTAEEVEAAYDHGKHPMHQGRGAQS